MGIIHFILQWAMKPVTIEKEKTLLLLTPETKTMQ